MRTKKEVTGFSMKAAILHKPNDLRLEEIDVPSTGPDEMLVKVRACALCGTDTRIYRGTKTKGVHYPSVIGHEISGVIETCGERVRGFEAGDAVTICPVISCGVCYACRRGMDNICLNRTAFGYEYDGGFQEFVRVPEVAIRRGNVFKAPQGFSFEVLALIEPLACCYNGNRRSQIKVGDTVVIMGAGPIGLMHLQLARLAGASKIIVAELLGERRDLAMKMGADMAVDPQGEDLTDTVLKKTGGLGADAVILAIGVPDLVNSAFKMTRKQGNVNLFAGFGGTGESKIEANIVHYNELNVTGTASAAPRHFEAAMNLVTSGKIDLEKLISHRFPLEEIHTALDTILKGKGMKVVLVP
jgi:L-iditol 2-dehydrogenase